MAQAHASDTCCMGLMNLPEDILYSIFAHLDEAALCEAAQICPAFLRLAGMQCLELWLCLVYSRMAQKWLTIAHSLFQAMQTSGCTCLRASCQVGMLFRPFQEIAYQQQVIDPSSRNYRGQTEVGEHLMPVESFAPPATGCLLSPWSP